MIHEDSYQELVSDRQSYDYFKRKSYEQTDQSVRNFFSWNNYNTVL